MSQYVFLFSCMLAAPPPSAASRPVASSRAAGELRPAASRPSAAELSLHVVSSADGLKFDAAARKLFDRSCNPTLARLADGALLLVFDHAAASSGESNLHLSRSSDDGRTWSAPRPVRFSALDAREIATMGARGAALISMPDGATRMFFTMIEKRGKGRATIRAAVTTDGREFRMESTPQFAVPDGFEPGLLALHMHNALHLYASDLRAAADPQAPDQSSVSHFVCRDGKRWAEMTPIRLRGARLAGGVLGVRRFWRTYAESGGGIASLVTKDGRVWAKDVGMRLESGRSAAAAALKDGSVLMVYSAEEKSGQKRPELAKGMGATGVPGGPAAGRATDGESAGAGNGGAMAAGGGADGGTAVRPDEVGGAQADAEEVLAGSDLPFPPKADFKTRIDYLSYYRDELLDQGGDNAYPYYAAFMQEPGDVPGSKPEWPTLVNMFKNAAADTVPGPWNPREHADWESSNQAAQSLLAMFEQATQHENYASPVQYEPKTLEDAESEPLLLGILLPTLSQHRDLSRQTLADAWRTENGHVSPEKMIHALQTTLRGAAHLHQGPTLIEQLVGTAEQNLAHDTARRALQGGVFGDAAQMRQALDVLRSNDPPAAEPARALRGEYAMAMDTVQYMFEPSTPGGPPAPNAARINKVGAMGITEPGAVENMLKMNSDDVTRTVDAFDAYYRELAAQMRVGYPSVRAADVMATQQKYVDTSPVTHAFVPALSRVYQMRARNEASRRATQLAYAVQIYKAETGNWPASLSELPAEFGDTMRTDPFSGQTFGYRMTRDGPLIYSLSENGRDDGGIHSAKWDDGRKPGEGDDHVFWPPAPAGSR